MLTLLFSSILACNVAGCASGNCGHVATTYQYTAPVASYGYQNYAVNTVVTKLIAVKPAPEYVAVAGDYVRAPQNNEQIAKLTGMVEALVKMQQVQQPTAQQPYASPQQYAQPSPQQYNQPVQPSPQQYGQAPPPPLLPSKGLPSKGLPYAQPPSKSGPVAESYSLIGDPSLGAPVGSLSGALPAGLTSCMQCHTAGSARGGFTMFSAPGVAVPLNEELARRIDDAIREGRMPQRPYPPLNVLQYSEVRDWLEAQSAPALNTANR